jgi:hypothetical protein
MSSIGDIRPGQDNGSRMPGSSSPPWKLGSHKTAQQWQDQMQRRGWTPDQITEAIQNGQRSSAQNLIHPSHSATRYVHPITGRSVVVDDVTQEVLHVGADGFVY